MRLFNNNPRFVTDHRPAARLRRLSALPLPVLSLLVLTTTAGPL